MPVLDPGTVVAIRPEAVDRFLFAPPDGTVLLIAVHEAALNSPESTHTQLLGFDQGELVWAGALSEHVLEVVETGGGGPRQLLSEAIGCGTRLWDVIWPGELMTGAGRDPRSTTYQGERPWVVVGETSSGDLLAAPLNEDTNPKWFTPLVYREEVLMTGSSKDAQLELAHVWSFPSSVAAVGSLAGSARERILEALKAYF